MSETGVIPPVLTIPRPQAGEYAPYYDRYISLGPGESILNTLDDLVEDFIAVRRATLSLLRNLDEAAWSRRGIPNKNEVSVRGLAYIIAGHELHHRRILEEKYFASES